MLWLYNSLTVHVCGQLVVFLGIWDVTSYSVGQSSD